MAKYGQTVNPEPSTLWKRSVVMTKGQCYKCSTIGNYDARGRTVRKKLRVMSYDCRTYYKIGQKILHMIIEFNNS